MPVYTYTYCRGCGQMVGIPWGKPPICDPCRREQQKAAEEPISAGAALSEPEPVPPRDAA